MLLLLGLQLILSVGISSAAAASPENIDSHKTESGGCSIVESTVFVGHARSSSLLQVRRGSSSASTHVRLSDNVTKQDALILKQEWEKTYQELLLASTTSATTPAGTGGGSCVPAIKNITLLSQDKNKHSYISSQPLPPWYHYDHMLEWNVQMKVPHSHGKVLFAQDQDPNHFVDRTAFQSTYSNRINKRHLRHLEQVEQLLEVSTFDCNSDKIDDFKATLVVQVNQGAAINTTAWEEQQPSTAPTQAPNQSPSAQLYEDIQIWKQLMETTYNSLIFFTCDAPTFRTLTRVRVQELFAGDINEESSSRKLLEFTLTVDCHEDDQDSCEDLHEALFGSGTSLTNNSIAMVPKNSTTNATLEGHANATNSILPLDWRPPTWEDLQGPLVRQGTTDSCYCAASHRVATTQPMGAPTPQQFLLALNQTLQGLRQEGFMQDYAAVETLTQVEEMDCSDDIVSLETHVLLQLREPLFHTTTTTIELHGILEGFQTVYNQLSLLLCDEPLFRRIVNVTLFDQPDPSGTQLTLAIQAECHGCSPQDDLENQPWLFSNNTMDKNPTLWDISALPQVPLLTCACPHTSNTSNRELRPPTVGEVTAALNARLLEQSVAEDNQTIAWLQQVEDYECRAPTEFQKGYTNVLVNFTGGNPQRLSSAELKVLETSFQKVYNEMAFSECDGKFRQITEVQLLILPRSSQHSHTTDAPTSRRFLLETTNTTNTTALDWNATDDNADWNATNTSFTGLESNVTSLPTFEEDLEVTSVFRVGVECRRCPADEEAETFGLFDSFDRRRQLQQGADRKLSLLNYQSGGSYNGMTIGSGMLPAETTDTCYCPSGGRLPADELVTSQHVFLEIFQVVVEELANKSALESVKSIRTIEEDRDFCFNELIESDVHVAMDFEEYNNYRNMTLYTDEDVREAFRWAANSVRDSDCAPLVQEAKEIQKVPGPVEDNGATSRQGDVFKSTTRVEVNVVVLKSSESYQDYVDAHSMPLEDQFWGFLLTKDAFKTTEFSGSEPSAAPSSTPSATAGPSATPSARSPSTAPSDQPSTTLSSTPSKTPSSSPSTTPSLRPSDQPSIMSSGAPSDQPSSAPTAVPSFAPTSSPTLKPTPDPTNQPTPGPTLEPTPDPTLEPTKKPTPRRTHSPSVEPSVSPSSGPSSQSSEQPSSMPSSRPSGQVTNEPSSTPSKAPSVPPSPIPSSGPSAHASDQPSILSSSGPSAQISNQPSRTVEPSYAPSSSPSDGPLASPSMAPSSGPSVSHSAGPSLSPSSSPSSVPTPHPTLDPTGAPTPNPTSDPTSAPTVRPRIAKLFLVIGGNNENEQDYIDLKDGQILDLAALPANVILKAETVPPNMATEFILDGMPLKGASFSSSSLSVSSTMHTLQATPFVAGVRGTTLQIQFSVGDSSSSLPSTGATSESPSVSSKPSSLPSSHPTAKESEVLSAPNWPSNVPSATPSALPSASPSSSSKPSTFPSIHPTAEVSDGPTASSGPSKIPSTLPSSHPSASPSASSKPSTLPSSHPTSRASNIPSGSSGPSSFPSSAPSESPSRTVSESPSVTPSESPSEFPSQDPTAEGSNQPSSTPSTSPSALGSISPTDLLSESPSSEPSSGPSMPPSVSGQPSATPSYSPSGSPSIASSRKPSSGPSISPSATGSESPSGLPSQSPSRLPSQQPSGSPSGKPSSEPSMYPSVSGQPSEAPSSFPSESPSNAPSQKASSEPSMSPSVTESGSPSGLPSQSPSVLPSLQPSESRSSKPSSGPSVSPSMSSQPSEKPSAVQSDAPSFTPSSKPSSAPSNAPSRLPSEAPSRLPSSAPSGGPSTPPSTSPSSKPSGFPSTAPSVVPSQQPSSVPSDAPSQEPSQTVTVLSWHLVNADSNEDIRPIYDGEVLNLATLPDNLNIRAEVTAAATDVYFYENGVETMLQRHYPYCLADDRGGDYWTSNTLKILTPPDGLRIKAVPYVRGTAGMEVEITIHIVNTGKVSVGGSIAVVGLHPYITTDSVEKYYYGKEYCCDDESQYDDATIRANTPDNLENGNVDGVTFALVQNGNGIHILVIYDAPVIGTSGSVIASITGGNDLANELVFSDERNTIGFPTAMFHSWSAGNTDGYALGPYPEPTEVCFTFSFLINLDNGARFLNNPTPIQLANDGSELAANEICIKTPPPV